MKFNSIRTSYELDKADAGRASGIKSISWREHYDNVIAKIDSDLYAGRSWNEREIPEPDLLLMALSQFTAEREWYSECRPYFKVWPSIVDALTRIRLDVKLADLDLARRVILLRFCEGKEPTCGSGMRIKSVLCSYAHVSNPWLNSGFLLWPVVDVPGRTVPVNMSSVALTVDGETIEKQLEAKQHYGLHERRMAPELNIAYAFAAKVAITTLLLANDPSIITPDVLAADRQKFDETGDPKYIVRAKKKGVVGWRIGEEYETCPHFRRPHFALRHTGKGKTIPKIVPVKGAVVHRSKITQVPTGYLTPEGVEVES